MDTYIGLIEEAKGWLKEDEPEMVPHRLEQIRHYRIGYARDEIRQIWHKAEMTVYHTYRDLDDDPKARAIWQEVKRASEVWLETITIHM